MSLFAWIAGLYGALALAAFLGQRAMMYPAPRRGTSELTFRGLALERIPSAGGTVYALHAKAPQGAPTLVYFHGNGEDLSDMSDLLHAFSSAGLGVYAVEYPGYGLMNDRAPTESALYAAAAIAIDHLQKRLNVPLSRTVLVGHSLGSGVAAEMARRGSGSRLVLISPYTSMVDMASQIAPFLPARVLIRDRYDTRAKAPELSLPALVVHGGEDEVIPVEMGKRIAELLPAAKLRIVPHAGHNDLFAVAPELIREIARFAKGE